MATSYQLRGVLERDI